MTTDLRELCYSSDSSQSPSEIIEHCVDSDISEISQPASIHDLDAEVSRLLDYHSSGSESNDKSGRETVPLAQNTTSRFEHVPQTETHHRLVSTGNTVVPIPMKDKAITAQKCHLESNSESHTHSKPPLDSTDGETKKKHEYKPTSVRGGASLVSTSEDRTPPVKASQSDCKPLHLSGEMPPSLGEDRSMVKNLAVRQLQSDRSLKSSPMGSLQGTPSASSSQLYYDSDECTPRPLAEELEEVTVQETLESQALAESKQGSSLLIWSSESSSSSEFSNSEEESEEGLSESDEQHSSEEIDFELQEGDPSSQNLPSEHRIESQHPLLSVISTVSKPKHNSSPSNDSSKCVHSHKKLEAKTTNNAGKAGLHLQHAHKHAKSSEVVQRRSNRSLTQTQSEAVAEGSQSSQQALDSSSAANHSTFRPDTHDIPSSSGSSLPPVKSNQVLQKERCRREGSISTIEIHADTQNGHQRPRYHHKNPSNDLQLRNPHPPTVGGTNTEKSGAVLIERHDKTRCDKPNRNVTERIDKPTQPTERALHEFHLEDLIHSDSEQSVISAVSEASFPSTAVGNLAHMHVPTPAQMTVECNNSESGFNESLCHIGNEGSGIVTPVGKIQPHPQVFPGAKTSSLTPKTMSYSTNIHSPPSHALALHTKSTTVAATTIPLRGILKKKTTAKGGNSRPTEANDKMAGSNAPSHNSVVDADKTGSTTTTTTPDSPQPAPSGQCVSSHSLPENTRTSVHNSTLLSSKSGSDDDCDLDRTLTEDHIPSSSATTPSVVSTLHIVGASNSGGLNQTDQEVTLVTSDNGAPLQNGVQDMGSENLELLCTQHLFAQQNQPRSSSSRSHHVLNQQHCSSTQNIQLPPVAPPPESPPLLLLNDLTHTDSEATILSGNDITTEDETDCLPSMPTHTATEDKMSFQGNCNLVSKVYYYNTQNGLPKA